MFVRIAPVAIILASLAPALPAVSAFAEPTYGHRTAEEARAALNREQAQSAASQLAENAANRQAYEDAQRAREEQIRRDQDAYEQEQVRIASEHEAAMEAWRIDVSECRAGDRSRCRQR